MRIFQRQYVTNGLMGLYRVLSLSMEGQGNYWTKFQFDKDIEYKVAVSFIY